LKISGNILKKIVAIQLNNCIGIVLFIFLPFTCLAQPPNNYQFNHFSIDHSLSQTVFQAILQDKKGYMWFGTRHGLIKYDGYTLTHFEFDPNNKNALPDHDVYRLCEDSAGNLWLSSSNSSLLSKYNQHTGIFTAYRQDDNNKFAAPPGIVTCMVTDKRGQLWIGTEAGLCYYEAATGRIVNLSAEIFPDTLCSRSISCLMADHKGLLWIGTGNGINIYDPVRKKTRLFNPGDKNYTTNQAIASILEDHSGVIWISVNGKGIYRYNSLAGTSNIYRNASTDPNSVCSNYVNSLLEDHHYNIWACSYDAGISIYQPVKDNFKTFRSDINNNHSLTSNQVVTFYEDRSGVLWIGTNGGGLVNCNLTAKKFDVFNNWDKQYISYYPLSLYKDHSGKIYMTTFGRGMQEFNPSAGTFKSYQLVLTHNKTSAINYCYGAFEASDGNFYIAGYNSGFHKIDRKANKFTSVIPGGYQQDTGYSNLFNCITEDLDKRLWIGTNKGLKCYDMKANKYHAFEQLYRDTNELSKTGIVNLYCDREGMLWIAGSKGLLLLNTKTGKTKIFKHNENDPASISHNIINYFYDDNKGAVWIATDGGLNRFDKQHEKFTAYTIKNGLPGNAVIGILPGDDGNLWLSTNKGICKFTPPSYENGVAIFRNYNVSDGLPSDEYYYTTSVKANDGTLYFASTAGLVAFKPGDIIDNSFAPPVIITDFKVLNKSITAGDSTGILKLPADETKVIKLSYQQNIFSFTFSAMSYVHPEKNLYAYMLVGFDRDWNYTDATNRFANYTNLDAGTYTFKVKASNNDGVWNDKGVFVKLIITPPWWLTWWFKLLCFLAAAMIGYAIYNTRMQKIRDVRRIRNKIASDLHDDLGATLSSISIMSELVNQQVKDKVPQASSILEKIGSSSRNMIESVNDMVWAINPQNDSFENIVKRMRTFASEILSAKDIAFHFDFDKNLLQYKLKMEMRRNFYLIFKEAVNNLAKYSEADNAFVMIWNRENNLKMTIRDDGNGFDHTSIVGGNGLNNMQQRADMIKATFRLESVPGKGTIIELEFKNG
jgi:ligand-binding sensor domain-containing protein/two-component sensor histidine kinase